MKYLKIKEREKGKGEFVYCTKCNRAVNNLCMKTGKKIYTCKYPESQSFKARYHVPNTVNTKITKTFDTRVYEDFIIEKMIFFKWLKLVKVSAENVNEVREVIAYNERSGIPLEEWVTEITEENHKKEEEKKKEEMAVSMPDKVESGEFSQVIFKEGDAKPMDYESVVQMFLDHIAGLDEIEIKANKRSDDYVQELATYYNYFAIALKNVGHHAASFQIDQIGNPEVISFHKFLHESVNKKGEQRFGSHAYNKGLRYMSKLINYLNDKHQYNLKDEFIDVKRKSESRKGKNDSIWPDEFAIMLSKITKRNGWGTKLDRGNVRKIQHFQAWLKLAFKLAIETGERRDGIALMKWNDVDMRGLSIEIRNHKVSNIKKVEILREIPITIGLEKVLKKLGYSKYKNTDNFIVAPDRGNRNMVMQILSRSFTHYWMLTGIVKKNVMSFKRLRKTYVTIMYMYFGDQAEEITGQTIDNMTKNYVDKKLLMMKARNISLEKVYEDLQLAAER